MKTHFSSFEQYTIAEASIDESQINGQGGAPAPILTLPVSLDVSHGYLSPQEGLEIISLEGKLMHNAGSRIRSAVSPIHHRLEQKFSTLKQQHCYLEFSINANWLAAIEAQRAGGDVKFRVELLLLASKLFALNERSVAQPGLTLVWGYCGTWRLHLQADLIIPRDTWISQVLSRTGYGITHILEFPAAPVESRHALNHSFMALKQAEEKHRLGFYDDAAGKCRLAIEPFFEFEKVDPNHPASRTIPVLKKSWETKLGKATYDWLKVTLGSIKDAANVSHHSPNAHYSQLDSQMILAVTTAVVAYIARNLKPEELK